MSARLTQAPRVLMSTDAVGGVWTYAIDLAAGLVEAGLGVTLAILGPPPTAAQRRQARSIVGMAVATVSGPLDWSHATEASLGAVARRLARLARACDVDLVHLNSPALASLAAFDRPVLGVCHSCVASWWDALREEPLPYDFAWRRDLLARGYAACGALIAPSLSFARVTERLYGVRATAVLNGRRARVPPDVAVEDVVLTAGRLWDAAKDMTTLDAAAALLDRPVVALGALSAPDGASIALSHVRTLGVVDAAAVAGWMARAPIFVSTARYEPFGLAVLEAAQSGAALVLADIPSFRELWNHAAVFVTPGDARGFATAIEGLAGDATARSAAQAAARRRAGDYTVEAMTSATLAQYRSLAPEAFARPAQVEVAA